ncbi:CaiB/BaiF CoA transferase family protein [Nocardioides sp. LHG3406-4]|uniref:CaiB/BaiF CoA transferase family protein n=1 Tax=Nocardioides sp. LHG3406-4 TaxID=2804575 RepID=UPI003CF68CD8
MTRSLPLAGVRILDFTQVQFGPIATQVLADYGADVIKVERPGVGDLTRSTDVQATSIDDSAYFLSLNRNKRSLTLDLKSPVAADVLHRALETTDVLVENFRPGVMDRLGFGYDALAERYPRLVYAAGTGFGRTGPLAHKGGQDLLAQAMSGAAYHARGDDGRPRLYPLPVADYGAGMSLVQGVLLALLERERSGRGQRVDVSLLDTISYIQLQEYVQWRLHRFEVNWETQNLAGVFATSDGWIAVVGMFKPDPLRHICQGLGIDDLSQDPRFATLEQQLARKDELWPLLEVGFAKLTTDEAVTRLDEQDVLCAPVLDYDQFPTHPQAVHNGIFREVDHPTLGRLSLVESPLRLSEASADQRPFSSPPLLGQHTDQVLDELGYSAEEIASLRDRKVVS